MNAPPITILEVNAELNARIGTAEPLFRAQHYYEHRNDACGCDSEYPAGAFDATIEAIHDITGIPQRAVLWAIHDAWEQGRQVRSDHTH